MTRDQHFSPRDILSRELEHRGCLGLGSDCAPEATRESSDGPCSHCLRYVELLGAAAEPRRPLPEQLGQRLRQIALPAGGNEKTGDHGHDRSTEPRAEDPAPIIPLDQARPISAEHLFAEVARDSRNAPRRPLPSHLRRKLADLPRAAETAGSEPRAASRFAPANRPPSWLLDGRLATAACALIATLLSFSTGDASALFRDTTSPRADTPRQHGATVPSDSEGTGHFERFWIETRAGLADSWSRRRDGAYAWLENNGRSLRDSQDQWSSQLEALVEEASAASNDLDMGTLFRSKETTMTDTEAEVPPDASSTQGSP